MKATFLLKCALLIVLVFLTGRDSILAQESTLVRFVVKNIESKEQLHDASIALNNLPGVELSRTDISTRNHVTVINSPFNYSESFFNETLANFDLTVSCFHSEPYTHQSIVPLNARDCIREIEELSEARTGDCCTGHGGLGCLNAACQAFVCGQDGFCCSNGWDAICANIAIANANASGVCAGQTNCPGVSGGGSGPCCTAHTGTGCQNTACQTAVCALDAFCCNNQWDGVCAGLALNNANAGGACSGVSNCPSASSAPCCSIHPNLGCENAACQTAVCNIDPFCCSSSWDAFCVAEAIDNANAGGACSGNSDCPTGTGNPVTAGDCQDAVDVCSDINFTINPNGFGSTNEICLNCVVNPSTNPTSTNFGCLLAGELNSTWMIVNIEVGGELEFTFGGLGTQNGYYDWALWPYDDLTCNAIVNNSVAPWRCNWNGVDFGGTGLANALPTGGNATNYETPLNVLTGDQYLICFSNWSSVTTSVPLEFYGTAQVSCDPILVLPVELVSFTSKNVNNDAHLFWQTTSETNNDYFLIERSNNETDWQAITTIQGAGNSTQLNSYNVIDPNPGSGQLYYRLSQFDFDGSKEIISVASLFIGVHELIVFPNPTNNFWQISYPLFDANATIELYNLSGQKVKFEAEVINNQININLSDFRQGIYFLTFIAPSGEKILSTKLVAH
jgi:hypothetical protein